MAGAEQQTHAGEGEDAFGTLFDICLKAFLLQHSNLFWEESSSSSGSSSSSFEPPQELLLRLQQTTGMSLDSDAESSSNSSSSSSNSKEQQEDWSLNLYRCLLLLHKVYRHLRLISPNESADDISSSVLRFLLLPYCLGLMTLERPGQLQERPLRLREAQIYFLEYLHCLESAELLNKEEINRLEAILDAVANPAAAPAAAPGIADPAARRTKLVEEAKAEKQLSNSVKALLSQKSGGGAWSSEEERRLSLLLLQLCTRESFKQLDFIRQETPMLMRLLSNNQAAVSRSSAPKPPEPAASSQRPWTATFRNKEELRNFIRSRVFQPSHNLPTMSLAECADIEMEMETRQIGAAKPKVVVEFPTGEARQAAKEAEELEARKWDDWKQQGQKISVGGRDSRAIGGVQAASAATAAAAAGAAAGGATAAAPPP
ncbi:immunoglobulin-binding protein, putative [Eimeria tenella]|uniref:Immunoglobulin-binding protein, putative n=1 Tax=Eimeria tenella TaxID=5802 RepID=U6KJE7_EIMTE|nr:immunoglobulin-binding protein, putative [Eimeria tenella]CDJ38165.1 immunoglobulin-binding protein, putative [Eimeria tenella]|eukprot:XP_013229003.1 immunoglobulin-binding protein, putative [Eimeria tenella]